MERTTIPSVVRSAGGVLWRKGLLLATLVIALGATPLIVQNLASASFVIFRTDAVGYWLASASLYAVLPLIFCITAMITLADLRKDPFKPGAIVSTVLRRWPAMVLVAILLSPKRLVTSLLVSSQLGTLAVGVRSYAAILAVVELFSLIVSALAGLSIPVLMQEKGTPLFAFRRAYRLSEGFRGGLVGLIAVRTLALSALSLASQLPNLPHAALWLSSVLVHGLWVVALSVIYLEQIRTSGKLPATMVSEVFD